MNSHLTTAELDRLVTGKIADAFLVKSNHGDMAGILEEAIRHHAGLALAYSKNDDAQIRGGYLTILDALSEITGELSSPERTVFMSMPLAERGKMICERVCSIYDRRRHSVASNFDDTAARSTTDGGE